MAQSASKVQSPVKRCVAVRCHLRPPWITHPESERSLHSHYFYLHNWLGWWLRCSHLRKTDNGGEKLQPWTILLGKSCKACLFGCLLVDLLYMLRVSLANLLSHRVGYFQLRACCFGCVSWSHYALVVARCEELVQGAC